MRKNWLWYQMFRYPLVKTGLNLFYKKIVVRGREKLPKDTPILFVPNHQNSFMDALHVVTTVWPFIYFLTRAQAFNPPLMAKFLRSLNMLPVYRVRDGLSSVTKNNAIFEECIRYMKRNDAILVFPEANHDLKRRVRPLSKGFTRIAFDAEKQSNWEMGLQVIPVGLNYTSHPNSRNRVEVVYGDPIDMKQFEDLYNENEREATNALKKKVSDGMKKTIMHVPNLDHYPLHHVLLDDLEQEEANLTNPDIANANVQKIEEHFDEEMLIAAKEVREIYQEFDLDVKTVTGRRMPVVKMILLFPLYLFSWINNMIPYQPVRHITTKVIKDHAFDASIKFLLGLTLFPLFWILVTMILLLAGTGPVISFGYLGVSVITSIQFKDANQVIRNIKEKRKLDAFSKASPEKYRKFVNGIKKLNEFRREVL